jgi:hypothetical protein
VRSAPDFFLIAFTAKEVSVLGLDNFPRGLRRAAVVQSQNGLELGGLEASRKDHGGRLVDRHQKVAVSAPLCHPKPPHAHK